MRLLTVPSGVKALAVRIDATTSPDMDLFVGTGSTPMNTMTVCTSAQQGSVEMCVVENPAPGQWWVDVQNFQSSGTSDSVTTSTAMLTSEEPAAHLTVLPDGNARPGTPQPLTLSWDEPLTTVGARGFVRIRATHGLQTASSVAHVAQFGPDVAVAPVPGTARMGDVVPLQAVVNPDLTGESPVHDVAVTLPHGWSVAGSLPADGTQEMTAGVTTVRWRGTHAELAAAAGTDASAPVTLAVNATVARPGREGDTTQVVVEESVTVPGGGSQARHSHPVVVTGGTYPTTTLLSLTSASSTDEATPQTTATVQVTGAALATPSGGVTILAGTTVIGSGTIGPDGSTQVDLAALSAGSHSLTARYEGDAANEASTSAPATLAVGVVQHPTRLQVSAPARTTRQKATVRVAVVGGPAGASGTVTVTANGKTLARGQVVDAVASLSLAPLPAGRHRLTVQYSGDTKHQSSTATATLVVTAPPRAAVRITATPPKVVRRGRPAGRLTVRVSAPGAVPRGLVTVTLKGAGRSTTKTLRPSASGRLSVPLGRYRKAGKVTVTVRYAGDTATLPGTLITRFTVRK